MRRQCSSFHRSLGCAEYQSYDFRLTNKDSERIFDIFAACNLLLSCAVAKSFRFKPQIILNPAIRWKIGCTCGSSCNWSYNPSYPETLWRKSLNRQTKREVEYPSGNVKNKCKAFIYLLHKCFRKARHNLTQERFVYR